MASMLKESILYPSQPFFPHYCPVSPFLYYPQRLEIKQWALRMRYVVHALK